MCTNKFGVKSKRFKKKDYSSSEIITKKLGWGGKLDLSPQIGLKTINKTNKVN